MLSRGVKDSPRGGASSVWGGRPNRGVSWVWKERYSRKEASGSLTLVIGSLRHRDTFLAALRGASLAFSGELLGAASLWRSGSGLQDGFWRSTDWI